ncbi:hypothetical protein C7S18_17945 [Ahniella affigens]|uniref:Abnormal spindle-like microcephaly-associated protein ASH domain-containing protein n=1 Tax=Ahniella affigens TaxID=2021234 RepID=A0A2P1PVT3_9GAMM|nr:choice-of-anchor D domain-containing protein [Ahniella affigens]AVP98940.1 hypothetical protein C7S18_17945 [Ahniella affigens]
MFCPTAYLPLRPALAARPRAILPLLLALSLLLAAPLAGAQNVNVSPNPATYATLKAAFDAINSGTHTGAVIVDVVGDTTETQMAQLNASGSGAANYSSVMIRPSGARTISGNAGSSSDLIRLNGADQVTIDGLRVGGNSLTIDHLPTNADATIGLHNGASNNHLARLQVLGSAGNVIRVMGDTVSGTGNDSNVFEDLDIGASAAGTPRYALFCSGSTNTPSVANQFNQVLGSRISDAFQPGQDSALILLGDGCNRWTLDGNRLFQTAPRTFTGSVVFRAIEINSINSNGGAQGYVLRNNVIGATNANGTGVMSFSGASGKFRGVALTALATGAENLIEGNEVSQINLNTAANGTAAGAVFTAFHVLRGPTRVLGNRVGAMTQLASISVSCSSNVASEILGINSTSDDDLLIANNQIGGMRYEGTAATSTAGFQVIGIVLNPAGRPTQYVSGNQVGGDMLDSMTVLGNSTQNAITGILSVQSTSVISDNVVQNLTGTGGIGTGSVASVNGIVNSFNIANVQVVGNTIRNLRNTHASATTMVRGISVISNDSSVIADNWIERLDAASSADTAVITGINVLAPGATARNNMVALGADVNGAPISASRNFIGINEGSSGTQILHNSVLIFGSNVQGAKPTVAFASTQASPTRIYHGNSFSNQRSNGAAGTGRHSAIRLTATPAYSNFLSNWNNLHASGAGAMVAEIEQAMFSTLAAWQQATLQDAASVSVDPLYVGTDNLHLQAGSSLRALVPANALVMRDFDQSLRPVAGPFDVGADEVSGTTPASINAAILAVDEPQTPGFRATGASFTPRVRIENRGGSSIQNATVSLTIRDAGNMPVYERMLTIQHLDPGATARLDFAATAVATAGAYTWTASVSASGDTVPSDDQMASSLTVGGEMSGTYTVGSGGNFASLSNPGGAFQVLSALGASTPIELQIMSDLNDETGTYALRQLAAGSSVLIRPVGAARVIRGSSLNALIRIEAADNVTIDGSTTLASSTDQVAGTPSLRELTLINESPGFGALIHAYRSGTGADNNTFRNLQLQGLSRQTTQTGIQVGAAVFSTGAQNNGVRIDNCAFRKTAVGIAVYGGGPGALSSGAVITRNDLAATGNEALGRIGIDLQAVTGAEVSLNRIGGIDSSQDARLVGMALGSDGLATVGRFDNGLVSRNVITGLRSRYPGRGVLGLALGEGTTSVIVNNMISDLQASAAAGEQLAGINIVQNTPTLVSIWHNAVHLYGDRGALPANMNSSYALRINASGVPVLDLKNNILANRQTSGLASVRARVLGFASNNMSTIDADANLYWSSGPAAQFASINNFGTSVATLDAWRTITGDDANSQFDEPLFVSDTDLHVQTSPLASPAVSAAIHLAAVAVDLDGDARAASERDIGADEVASPPLASLALSAAVLEFGSVDIGSSSAVLSVTLSNASAQGLRIQSISSVLAPFTRETGGSCGNNLPLIVAAGSSCSMQFRFNPTAAGLAEQVITFTHMGTGDQQLTLRGTGTVSPAELQVSPTQILFGSVRVGQTSATTTVTVSNVGGEAMNVTSLAAPSTPFIRASGSCASAPFVLNPSASCTLELAFAPTQRGGSSQSLAIDAGNAGSASIQLSGTGIQGVLQQSPAVMAFGAVNVGAVSATQTLSLGNTGDADLTITALSGLNAPFERVDGGDCSAALPLVLAPAATCSLHIRFSPLLGGSFEATLNVIHDGSGAASTQLTGTGLMPDLMFSDSFDAVAPVQVDAKQLTARIAALPFEHWPVDQAQLILKQVGASGESVQYWARKRVDGDGRWTLQWAQTRPLVTGQTVQTDWQDLL